MWTEFNRGRACAVGNGCSKGGILIYYLVVLQGRNQNCLKEEADSFRQHTDVPRGKVMQQRCRVARSLRLSEPLLSSSPYVTQCIHLQKIHYMLHVLFAMHFIEKS